MSNVNEEALQPECYKRHAEIDGHIKEGRFWRGVITTAVLSGIAIFIAQYNMALESSNRLAALGSKLVTIAESNIKRLDRLEDNIFYYKGSKGDKGDTGAQGIPGRPG